MGGVVMLKVFSPVPGYQDAGGCGRPVWHLLASLTRVFPGYGLQPRCG